MAVRNEQQHGALVIEGAIHPRFAEILNGEALGFLEDLARAFAPRIREALERRSERLDPLAKGATLDFLSETPPPRARDWKGAPLPRGLLRPVGRSPSPP